jgi:SWI/SNF-related matrix-associated actin-dependent regulator of chromatin subfamily D
VQVTFEPVEDVKRGAAASDAGKAVVFKSTSAETAWLPEPAEWVRKETRGEVDGFTINRVVEPRQPFIANILLYPRMSPPRFTASMELTEALSLPKDQLVTKEHVMAAVWTAIISASPPMHSKDEPHMVTCNDTFVALFRAQSLSFTDLVERVNDHLSPPPPMQIRYRIDPALLGDQESALVGDMMRLDVEAWLPRVHGGVGLMPHDMLSRSSIVPRSDAIAAKRKELSKLQSELEQAKKRQKFFQQFARDPVATVAALVEVSSNPANELGNA